MSFAPELPGSLNRPIVYHTPERAEFVFESQELKGKPVAWPAGCDVTDVPDTQSERCCS